MVGSDIVATAGLQTLAKMMGGLMLKMEDAQRELFKMCVGRPTVLKRNATGTNTTLVPLEMRSVEKMLYIFRPFLIPTAVATCRHVVRARRQRLARIRSAKAARLDCAGKIFIVFYFVFSYGQLSSSSSVRHAIFFFSERPHCALCTCSAHCIPTPGRRQVGLDLVLAVPRADHLDATAQ